MPESQVDRLKRELRFLKESFEAGIISEEEYMKGKKRIETKLDEWGEGVVEEYGKRPNPKEERKVVPKDIIVEEIPDDTEEIEEEQEDEEERYKKELLEKEVREKVQEEDEKESLKAEIENLQILLEEKNNEAGDREKEIRSRDKERIRSEKKIEKLEKELDKRDEKIKKLKDNGKNRNKPHFDVWKYVSLILALIIILMFFTNIKPDIENPIDPLLNETTNKTTELGPAEQEVKLIAVELIVLNDKNCGNCNTDKTIEVSRQLFAGVSVRNIDYNTEEGKSIYIEYNITYLPAYIFGEEIVQTDSWVTNERLRASFRQANSKYLLKEESTGSNYEPEN